MYSCNYKNVFLHNICRGRFSSSPSPLLAKTIICLPDCERCLLSKSFGWMRNFTSCFYLIICSCTTYVGGDFLCRESVWNSLPRRDPRYVKYCKKANHDTNLYNMGGSQGKFYRVFPRAKNRPMFKD